MKKLLEIVVLGLFCTSISFANPKKPTNEWLENKSVNDLTQKYGYKLFSVTVGSQSTTQYHLIYGKIVVTCISAPGNPSMKYYCMRP